MSVLITEFIFCTVAVVFSLSICAVSSSSNCKCSELSSWNICLQDKFRMCGARAFRHVFLFKRAIIIAKKKAEGLLLVKAFIMVG